MVYEEDHGLGCDNHYTLIRRTWTVSDNCDNSTLAEQIITVHDDIAPVFTFVPADYTVECYGDIMTEALANWLVNLGGAALLTTVTESTCETQDAP